MPFVPPWLDINPVRDYTQALSGGASLGLRQQEITQQGREADARSNAEQQATQERAVEEQAANALRKDEMTQQLKLAAQQQQQKQQQFEASLALKDAQLQQQALLAEDRLNQQGADFETRERVQSALGDARDQLEQYRAQNQVFNTANGLFARDPATGQLQLVPGTQKPQGTQTQTVTQHYPKTDDVAADVTPAVPAASLLSPSTWLNGSGSPAITNSPAITGHPAYSVTKKIPLGQSGDDFDGSDAAASLQAPDQTQSTGTSQQFKAGDKVVQNGKVYQFDGTSWNPVAQ